MSEFVLLSAEVCPECHSLLVTCPVCGERVEMPTEGVPWNDEKDEPDWPTIIPVATRFTREVIMPPCLEAWEKNWPSPHLVASIEGAKEEAHLMVNAAGGQPHGE